MTALTDQATRLRALAVAAGPAPSAPARHPGRAAVIAIASGKGGVGKTNLAVNLSIALADAGRETVLVDGDFGLGNADMLCGLTSARHIGSVLEGTRDMNDVAVRYRPALRIVPGGSGIASLADLNDMARARFADAFATLEHSADALILDCGAGLGSIVMDLLALADAAFIVTTPEPTAIADAYGLIKTLAARAPTPAVGSMHLVVNQSSGPREARDVHARIAAVSDRFLGVGVLFAGEVTADIRVSQSVRMRKPFLLAHPRCDAARDVRSLSDYVVQHLLRAAPRAEREESLITRLCRCLRVTG